MRFKALSAKQKRQLAALGGLAVFLFVGGSIAQNMPKLIVKAMTPSMPMGYYILKKTGDFKRGDAVSFRIPPSIKGLIQERRYFPVSWDMLKQVLGVPGDRVCRRGDVIEVEKLTLTVATRDRRGREMPRWEFCGTIPRGHYFLGVAHLNNSLDSRYFGLVAEGEILGAYRKL